MKRRSFFNWFTLLAVLISLIGSGVNVIPVYAASIVVNTNADNLTNDGLCTLREAITTANSDSDINTGDCTTGAGVDTITFAANYTITLTGTQLPVITTQMTITGNGASNTDIRANTNPNTATHRVFEVSATGNLTLNGLTVQNGRCAAGCTTYPNSGGGIANDGILIITDSMLESNSTTLDGGGIYNTGTLTITNSTFSANTGSNNGGSIHNSGGMTITDSIFSNNSSGDSGGGIFESGSSLTSITNTTFSNNSSTSGGGIYAQNNLEIVNSTLSSNTANFGGAITNSGSTITITNSTLTSNTATTEGGGIANYGTLNLISSTLSGNSADDGGGIHSTDTATITNSTLSGNSADDGGGIYVYTGSVLNIKNSTLSANSANFTAGGIYNEGTLHYQNNILANSINGDCSNMGGTIGTNASNLVESGGCSSVASADPNLGTLSNNGGATQTFALLDGSIAIDTGDNTVCAGSPVNNLDQRGLSRPQGTTCDIGAYEKMDASGFPTFADVPTNAFGWAHIESIYDAGITGGCTVTPLNYCPNNSVTRDQMAVFLLRGMHGGAYTPPAATGTVFTDVPISHPFAAWIEQFYAEGITGGCGGGNYCPNGIVTRAQMAVFLLRAKYGSTYNPPTATGTMFNDVPLGTFAPWIEQLANESITGGCGGGNYCPSNPVTRAQMAIFIQRTFGLPLP